MGEFPYTGDPGEPLPSSSSETLWENTICEPGSGFSPDSKFARSLIGDLQPPETWEAYFCENSCLRCSVTTARPTNTPVQFSCSVMSDCLWPHRLQHTRPPCPSLTPRVCSNSCPLSWWYHPTVSSSVIPFSSNLISFPASGSFPMSQLFSWGGQSIGVSASVSVLPMNTQDWSPLGCTGLILQSKGLPRVYSNTTVQKHQFFGIQLSL